LAKSKVRFFHRKLISRYFNPALNPADNDQFTQMSFFHRQFVEDDLIDELPVEKRHLSKLIIICRI